MKMNDPQKHIDDMNEASHDLHKARGKWSKWCYGEGSSGEDDPQKHLRDMHEAGRRLAAARGRLNKQRYGF
jgi:hypothetical protein